MRVMWGTVLFLLVLASAPSAEACAPAPMAGETVRIAEESAIIVWDAANHREHFIRRASFRATGKDFGFLVPTPDKPELAEVGDEVFDRFEEATRPAIVEKSKLDGVSLTPLFSVFFFSGSKEDIPTAASVRVLEETRVAGYDAVVLEADSPRALSDWLSQHGYADRPELAAWLAPYVAKRWKITAFKIATDAAMPAVATSAVRMTFTTARPFFPYREPSDERENSDTKLPLNGEKRRLRIVFIDSERVEGALGEERAPWPGKTIWADRLEAAAVAGSLPFPVPERAWMTIFEDDASPRPGSDDLFFMSAVDRTPVKPPPIVLINATKLPLPIDLIGGVGLITWLVVRGVKRGQHAKRTAG